MDGGIDELLRIAQQNMEFFRDNLVTILGFSALSGLLGYTIGHNLRSETSRNIELDYGTPVRVLESEEYKVTAELYEQRPISEAMEDGIKSELEVNISTFVVGDHRYSGYMHDESAKEIGFRIVTDWLNLKHHLYEHLKYGEKNKIILGGEFGEFNQFNVDYIVM